MNFTLKDDDSDPGKRISLSIIKEKYQSKEEESLKEVQILLSYNQYVSKNLFLNDDNINEKSYENNGKVSS